MTAPMGATIDQSVLDDLSLVLARLRRQDLSDDHVDQVAADVVEMRRLVDGLEVERT